MSSSSRSSGVTFASPPASTPVVPIPEVLKALIQFLASKKNEGVLWQYEDTTKNLTTIKSAEQIAIFLQHILRVFEVRGTVCCCKDIFHKVFYSVMLFLIPSNQHRFASFF